MTLASDWDLGPASFPTLKSIVYLSGADASDAGGHDGVGLMAQPGNSLHRRIDRHRWWAADNGCYAAGDRFDPGAWLAWLERLAELPASGGGALNRCLFAVLPDVVADPAATWRRAAPHRDAVAELGYPVALAAQNGLTVDAVEWDAIDALFIGGTTAWKLSEHAITLARHARALGKWTHMGRVNSWRRLRHAATAGFDSVDGTFLAFGPDRNLPAMVSWVDRAAAQPALFDQEHRA